MIGHLCKFAVLAFLAGLCFDEAATPRLPLLIPIPYDWHAVLFPLLGRISDARGRRPVLLFSLAGSTFALTATGLATGLWTLLAARFAAGLFAGSVSTAQAYVADISAPEDRAKRMGQLGAAIAAGFVFGPAVGGLLGEYGFSIASFCAAGLAFSNLILASFVLKESRRPDADSGRAKKPSLRAALGLFRRPVLGRVVLGLCLAMLAFVGMETTFPFLGKRHFDLTPQGLGAIFAITGVVTGIVQGLLLGRLSTRYGERALAIFGAVLMGASMFALPFAHSFWTASLAATGLALSSGLMTPSLHALLSRATPADEQGSVMGMAQGLTASVRAWGPGLSGLLYDANVFVPYFASAALMAFCAVLLRGLGQPQAEDAVAVPAEEPAH